MIVRGYSCMNCNLVHSQSVFLYPLEKKLTKIDLQLSNRTIVEGCINEIFFTQLRFLRCVVP